MNEKKLDAVTKLFEGSEIRSVWDSEKEDYYFSVVDVVKVLTESKVPRRYWTDLKRKLSEEGSKLYENIVQLKLESSDGKKYLTDTLDTKGIFRLIESVPSPKAEPFKMWLASLGKERIDEVFDPEKAIHRAVEYYLNHGYSEEWIERRLKAILDRNKLTKVWKDSGIEKDYEYGILTNEIYRAWSGMKASEYKEYKGIRKESLRDNMSDLELLLTDIGEVTTRELAKEHKPFGLEANKMVAKAGGERASNTRKEIEEKLGKKVINSKNNLNRKYLTANEKLETK